ncbi:MAG: hypothetical protein L0Y71_03155 [Gemmataceae bacterium]|nr:hypothetical protein [Gemmataceae bacterium]
MNKKTLYATVTGDIFQPVRLHYELCGRRGLDAAFRRLRCVQHDPPRGRWVWLFDHEAKQLPFKRAYHDLPKQLRPVVIGSFRLQGDSRLLLDVRSCERALAAVPFFDRHIPRDAAKVVEADIVNRLFELDEKLTPEMLFDGTPSHRPDVAKLLADIRESASQASGPAEKLELGLQVLEADAAQALPEIERVPIHYYEDGLVGFELLIRMRQMVAWQHWLGKVDYTLRDAMGEVLKAR